jgi:hypothetical protein
VGPPVVGGRAPILEGEGIRCAAFVKRQNPALHGPLAPDSHFWLHSEPRRQPGGGSSLPDVEIDQIKRAQREVPFKG